MERRGLASGSNDEVEGSSFWCIFFHTSCRQWVLVVSEIFCGHRRRRDSKFSVGCENRRHRLGLGLFLWSSEDWMQKKERNQRRPGRRRAEDVAWVTVSITFSFSNRFWGNCTAMQQQNREARACRRAPVPGPAASRPPLAITVERERVINHLDRIGVQDD